MEHRAKGDYFEMRIANCEFRSQEPEFRRKRLRPSSAQLLDSLITDCESRITLDRLACLSGLSRACLGEHSRGESAQRTMAGTD